MPSRGGAIPRRLVDIAIFAALLAVVAFAAFAVQVVRDIGQLRNDVERRVHWLQAVHRAQGVLTSGEGRVDLPLATMVAGLPSSGVRDDLRRFDNVPMAEQQRILYDLIPAIRRQNSLSSVRLGARVRALEPLLFGTLSLCGGFLLLALLVRVRDHQVARSEEGRLRAQHGLALLESQLELVEVGICQLDSANRLLRASRAVHRLTEAWEGPESWWSQLSEGITLPRIGRCPICATPETRGRVSVRVVPPGERLPRYFEITFGGHGHAAGGPFALVRDTTDSHNMELNLRAADRLASIGTMAASLVHEVNNPLASVMLNLDLLAQRVVSGDPEVQEALQDTVEGIDHVRAVATDLRNLSALADGPRGPVRVADVVGTAGRMAAAQVGLRGCLLQDVPTELPEVDGVSSQLAQVVLNLVLNAVQAMPEDVDHRIVVRGREADEGVVIEVEDDGPGIPADHQPHVFEPTFTTKPPGEGTGLGLFVCRRIVESHEGRINLQSIPGRTVVRVWLPTVRSGRSTTRPDPRS
ncbi:MAG: HAMP domain-containing histidine kinase [Myxococcales bacterium]|nr:HAMP domain-containing histidine kinase [Myxococcales bacterium]